MVAFERARTIGVLLIMFACVAGYAPAAAQPNPGIDPCSRVLAGLATPVDASAPNAGNVRQAVTQTVMNFASCFNRRNWAGVLALAAPEFRKSMFGVEDDGAFQVQLVRLDERGLLPSLKILSIEENGTTGSQLATLVVTWQGWNDVHRELWRIQQKDGFFRLTGRSIQTPHLTGRAVGLQFRLDTEGVTSPLTQIANPGIVLLGFQNALDQDSTALVLAVEAGRTAASIGTDCNSAGNEQFEPIGRIQLPAGETVTLPLQDLPPGRYAAIVGDDPCSGSSPVALNHIELLDITQAEQPNG